MRLTDRIEEYNIYYDDMKIYIRIVNNLVSLITIADYDDIIDISIPTANPEPFEPLIDKILDYLEERLQREEPNYYSHKTTYEEIITRRREK